MGGDWRDLKREIHQSQGHITSSRIVAGLVHFHWHQRATIVKSNNMTQEITFTNRTSYVIARAALDPAATRGAGGTAYPRLIFRVDWRLSATKDADADHWILSASAQLFNGQDADKIADATALSLRLPLSNIEHQTVSELEFPLDRYRVEMLEQRRNGGDMNLRVGIQLLLARFGKRVQFVPSDSQLLPLTLEFEAPMQLPSSLQIPQSTWIKNVLPGLGYGIINVLEFPAVPISAFSELQHAYSALQRAHTKFTAGEYDEAMWQCRTAIEPLREELKKIKDGNPNSLSADWAEKIGPATVTWLLTFFGKTYGVANTPSHSPGTGHFSRLDAQMILTVASAVLAYVARTKAPNGK